MGELLIKPYEISVWEDKLTQDGSRFVEKKLAVIGSNTMTGPNKVYEPVFNKKANGERTLTFSLKYKYFDPYNENHEVINPFVNLLINERKIKLKYGSDWYEFVIKERNESSDKYTWTYTCTDAFVLELSKNGYDLTFDAELNNNQGTAKELAKKVLEDTDWILDESSSVGCQLVTEPIYKAQILSTTGLEIVNTDNTDETIESGQDIYLFYSYVANKNGKFIQFIIRDDTRPYIIDDQNVITDTNFRIITDLVFKNDGFYLENTNTKIITWSEVETQFQANRLAYHQLTTYDPVTQRTVNCFKLGDREVYQYSDNTYTTSNVVINYITNGENFNSLEDGTLQGWSPYVELDDGNTVKALELVTKPELKTGKALANINVLSQVEGFLKAYFYGPINNSYHNLIFNSGAQDNASTIHSISKGQKFVFRWRAGTGDLNNLQPAQNLRLLVAKYTQDVLDHPGYYYKHIDPENIILDFSSATNYPEVLNNIITGGYIQTNSYIIDGVAQEPSVKYIYVDKNTDQQYIWNGTQGRFDLLTQNNYLPYYYLVAEASKTVSNVVLSDPAERIGIFIYTTGNEAAGYYYIEDIQLTAYIEDKETHKPILIGNVPTAASNRTDYYYLKPTSEIDANEVETYSTPEALIEQIGEVGVDELIPIYNEDSDKVLSIKASQSNCFNILQTIAETFECWVDLVVDHNDKGEITYTDGKPNKYVYLKEYAGKDNYAGFKYAINLQSIERNINSDEIVTKLIVSQSQSDYVDEGYISIANAPSNPSGEAYILNFDYYYNQGLLDRETVEEDKLAFITAVKNINTELQEKEKEKADLELALTKLNSKRTTYTELVETAKDGRNINLVEFEQLTGQTYSDYCTEHDNIIAEETAEGVNPEDSKQLTNEDTLLDILGEIYVKSAAINNYSGLLTNVNIEYTDLRLKLKGAENFKVKIWTEEDSNQQRHIYVELDDYLPYFKAIIDTSEYEFTVNKRYIDVISDSEQITFEVPPDSTYEMDSYVCTINDNKIQTFKITNTDTTQGVEDEIDDLLDQKQQLVKEFNNKYRRFIQEGTWNSTDYIDSELYYLDALQVSNTSAQPTVSYTINVVEISQLEGYEWYSFDAGDKTYVEDTEFFGWSNHNGVLTPAREEVIVSEVEWHLDEPENNTITVQNYKTRFEDLFQRINAAVQTVQYNEATYAKISTLLDADGTINSDVLINSINNLNGKKYNLVSDGSIIVEGDQILVRNLTNSANLVKINSEGIKISSDGGSSWATAIDGRGINLGTVYTGMLNTDQVIIGNKDNPSFRWDQSGISAYKSTQEGKYDLQTYVRYDEYGLYGIKNGEYFKANTLQDVLDKAHFAVTWDGFFIKNSYTGGGKVQITSENDFQVINADQSEKIKIGALEWTQDGVITTTPIPGVAPSLYGIRIKNNAGDVVMQTDDDGNLQITGDISATTGHIGGMVVNNDSMQMDHIILEPGVGIYSDILTENNEPVFIISDTDGSAVFNEITARGHIEAQTGTLGLLTVQDTITVGDSTHSGIIQSNGYVAGSTGWAIKSNGTAEFQNATVRGHIDATSGTLSSLDITGGITVAQNGYIKSNNYNVENQTGWEITDSSAIFNNVTARGHIEATTGTLGDLDVIDTITVGASGAIESSNWSTQNHTGWHIDDNGATFNNANVRGTITALQGDFLGEVRVGPTDQGQDHIIIDGTRAAIKSSNYRDGAGYGWMINKDGDAVFNNITARGAIKTAVFEYAEIQAVGGIFIFRPSSTIKSARISGNSLIVKVEKPALFAKAVYSLTEDTVVDDSKIYYIKGNYGYTIVDTPTGNPHDNEYYEMHTEFQSWCKISNYTTDGTEPNVNNILLSNGLTHVYRVLDVNLGTAEVTLENGIQFINGVIQQDQTIADVLAGLEGGALVDMGRQDGSSNYGIGVNSSDNTVNLPRRAISLFETIIDPSKSPKVSYKYRGILGTLPELSENEVNGSIYNNYMSGTQGIYTDNMYLGDKNQYLAFYTDRQGKKHLKLKTSEFIREYNEDTGEEQTWEDYISEITEAGDAYDVYIDSSAGNIFTNGVISTILRCYIHKGGVDITHDSNFIKTYEWKKINIIDGSEVQGWTPTAVALEPNAIQITANDVDSKAVFQCIVNVEEA